MTDSGSESGPRTKLEEQATAKAELSYSFFAKQAGACEPPPPRLLSEEEAKAQIEAERIKSAQGGSLWNHANTFEERSQTTWAKERLTSLLQDVSCQGVAVTSVNSVSGDANVWVVRGKRRFGFAFEITLAWKTLVTDGAVEIRGTVKVPNADADDVDDVTLLPELLHQQAERAAEEAAALKAVMGLKAPIEKVLQQFYEEFKQRP